MSNAPLHIVPMVGQKIGRMKRGDNSLCGEPFARRGDSLPFDGEKICPNCLPLLVEKLNENPTYPYEILPPP
ncbi:MAG: hypothetical protein PHW75_02030 [Patescibacteria group bacterium]|nr:hypothetical protein [Patescibacteria group bacterium]